MLLNSHISADATCVAEKICGLVRSTWGTSPGEDKPGARDQILDTKVVRLGMRRARAGQTFPLGRVARTVCAVFYSDNLSDTIVLFVVAPGGAGLPGWSPIASRMP